MSKSLSFCKQIAKERSGFADRPLDKAEEYEGMESLLADLFSDRENFSEEFQEIAWADGIATVKIRGITAEIHYNPNADFDYFTSVSSMSDGTAFFFGADIDRCLGNVVGILSYPKWETQPVRGDHIKYTIGNLVCLEEYGGDFVPDDKPWMQCRTTVMLPIKFERSDPIGRKQTQKET